MAMYHSWGSQNAWLRQIYGANRLFVNRRTAEGLGLADDDWVWIESAQGQVKAQIRLMEGVNAHTVWTWNAIGKRAGAWNLSPSAPETKRGFVLLPRRWVVERRFAWAARFRRPARDYERLETTLAGGHYVAFTMLLLQRCCSFITLPQSA